MRPTDHFETLRFFNYGHVCGASSQIFGEIQKVSPLLQQCQKNVVNAGEVLINPHAAIIEFTWE
jgi:hypothetical protein